jgi:hypothetical protein
MKNIAALLVGVAVLACPLAVEAQSQHGGRSSGGGAWRGGDHGGGGWGGSRGPGQSYGRASDGSGFHGGSGRASRWRGDGWGRPRYWAYGSPYGFAAFDLGFAFGLSAYPWDDPFWGWGPSYYSYTEVIEAPPPYGYREPMDRGSAGDAAAPAPPDAPPACGSWRWDAKTSQYSWIPCAPGRGG